MQVLVTTNCPRCNKKATKSVSLEDANALEANQEKVNKGLAQFESTLAKEMADCAVESFIVVAFKDADGSIGKKTLTGLCEGPRSCSARVSTLINEIFTPVKQASRKCSEKTSGEVTAEAAECDAPSIGCE